MLFNRAEILLPKDADMTKWSVVACDQYTSEPEYWKTVENTVGRAPSAYNLILPEVYLESADVNGRIEAVNLKMEQYLSDGVFKKTEPCYIYVERTLKSGKIRRGIMGCVDLECYDYTPGSKTEIRATEKTVTERIPPRLKVRENARLELPHVMLLLDDSSKEIIEPLSAIRDTFKKVYDFDLMLSSGHLKGFVLSDDAARTLENKLSLLGKREIFEAKYGFSGENPLVFAVGDGNHSLATAKAYYEEIKKSAGEDAAKCSPARYALAELVNLHDDSLEFEAIHRAVFDIDPKKFTDGLMSICTEGEGSQSFTLIAGGDERRLCFKNPASEITVGSVQNYIDKYISENGGRVDYIHGEDVVRTLVSECSAGILLDAMNKCDLFKTVIADGALPRKTFSMGEACDKRFYTEARIIK